jgi:hypothetical protein
MSNGVDLHMYLIHSPQKRTAPHHLRVGVNDTSGAGKQFGPKARSFDGRRYLFQVKITETLWGARIDGVKVVVAHRDVGPLHHVHAWSRPSRTARTIPFHFGSWAKPSG